jgi:hypothetical protein
VSIEVLVAQVVQRRRIVLGRRCDHFAASEPAYLVRAGAEPLLRLGPSLESGSAALASVLVPISDGLAVLRHGALLKRGHCYLPSRAPTTIRAPGRAEVETLKVDALIIHLE